MKKWLLLSGGIGLVVLLISGAAVGVALADKPEGGKGGIQQAFISKVAKILGIQEQQLKDAAKQAELEMVDDAVKAGKLNQDRANKLKERIEKGGGHWGPPAMHPPQGRHFGPGMDRMLPIKEFADFLGMKPADLMAELKQGKTPATIATEHGKTPEQVREAILSRLGKHLDEAVANGKLTKEKADAMKQKLGEQIDKLLNTSFKDLPKGMPHKGMPQGKPEGGKSGNS